MRVADTCMSVMQADTCLLSYIMLADTGLLSACRRHNAWLGNSDSNLLSLPPDILRDILKRVGKGATRFICAAARDAYGTPGTSICIPQLPEDKEATNVLLRWPDPAGVTQIRLYMLLNQSVGQALEARFTNLQELALLAYGERQIFAHLPGSIVRLTTLVYWVAATSTLASPASHDCRRCPSTVGLTQC